MNLTVFHRFQGLKFEIANLVVFCCVINSWCEKCELLLFCLQLPEFDNLYLDMNGIIHVCSHPEDNNPHFRITEEKIFSDIFHYIEV
jgi:5'-3' exonuclease